MIFDKIKLMGPMIRTDLKYKSPFTNPPMIECGWALDDGDGTIGLGKIIVGTKDVIEEYSTEKIITHETIHHLVREIVGNYNCMQFDSIVQHRSMFDSGRIYVQYDKWDVMCND